VNGKLEKLLRERTHWLEQKARAQRQVGGPDFTGSDLLRGRTQGEIGALKWLLGKAKKQPELGEGFC